MKTLSTALVLSLLLVGLTSAQQSKPKPATKEVDETNPFDVAAEAETKAAVKPDMVCDILTLEGHPRMKLLVDAEGNYLHRARNLKINYSLIGLSPTSAEVTVFDGIYPPPNAEVQTWLVREERDIPRAQFYGIVAAGKLDPNAK